jgi:hypothetical protein
VPTLVDRECRVVSSTKPPAVNFGFLDWNRYCPFKQLLSYPHEAEWTPFQAHYFSENLVAPGMEHGTSGSVARNSDHYTTEAGLISPTSGGRLVGIVRWLPTAAVRGSRPGRHVGFCGGQSGAGVGFFRVLRFPLPNSFHQLLQKIIIIIIINQSINHRGYVQ